MKIRVRFHCPPFYSLSLCWKLPLNGPLHHFGQDEQCHRRQGKDRGQLSVLDSWVLNRYKTMNPRGCRALNVPSRGECSSRALWPDECGHGRHPSIPELENAWHFCYSRHYADARWATYARLFVLWAKNGYRVHHLTQLDLHFESQDRSNQYRCIRSRWG